MASLFEIPIFKPEPGLIIWTWISFILLFAVLAKVGYKPILDIIKKREEGIRHSVDESERVLNEAQGMFDNYKTQLEEARKEAQEIIEQGKKVGESARAEITAKAGEEARQIMERTHAEIEREKDQAFVDLQADVADLTMLATSKVIARSLDEKSQRELVEEAIAEVSGVGKG